MHLIRVAIHNKNGKGLLHERMNQLQKLEPTVAIHNKNGKGLLRFTRIRSKKIVIPSQSTIKMEKGYYIKDLPDSEPCYLITSQSTIKMEKGYYKNYGGAHSKNSFGRNPQ